MIKKKKCLLIEQCMSNIVVISIIMTISVNNVICTSLSVIRMHNNIYVQYERVRCHLFSLKANKPNESAHERICTSSEGSDEPAYTRSLARAFT